jgi:uncharacterized membrane protein
MNWSRRYAISSYVRSSLWIVPVVALAGEQLALHGALAIDAQYQAIPAWPMGLSGTLAAMQAVISLILSFIVFTFGSMLVAIQVASGQLTPRIIATALLRDNVIRFTVGLFIFTLLFAIGTVSRIEGSFPPLTVWIAASLGLVSLTAFLYLIDYSARLLRPVSIVWRVADQGGDVIAEVYPNPLKEGAEISRPLPEPGDPIRAVYHTGASAIVLAADLKLLVAEAHRANGTIRFSARIGDFVAKHQPLFLLYGGAAAIADKTLRGAIAFGRERTIEQDSTFAFRVIVDIAIKALSKAINDPTTAVLAIDQLQRLLRMVGARDLHNEYLADRDGKVRLIFPTPNWEDFVQLTCREIRLYGAENFQVARRLRAMLETLEQALPESRRPALREERDLLDQMIGKVYVLPADQDLARIADTQGLGGASGS